MTTRVLVVDDSGFFRRRITAILAADPDIEVIGEATNGRDAIRQVARVKPDVVTMDIEMPVMDGITAVRRIMATHPTPIMMFSSLTYDGAQATLDALEAGAMDFLPKRFDDITKDQELAKRTLCNRVKQLTRKASIPTTAKVLAKPVAASRATAKTTDIKPGDHQIVAIACSTGGPVALQRVLTKLPVNFRLPIIIVQHMPASFTAAFAARLDQQCAIQVKEATDKELVRPGVALLAPGGQQMTLEQNTGQVSVHVGNGDASLHYKPCADITFDSVAQVYGGKVLAIVLTGMGADGREGSRTLKNNGATVWAQDEASCVIYGMPMAVAEAGLTDQVLPLDEIGLGLSKSV
jgi:two-component system, chemotaxis family, protein-glutamate methylesterase/glutaminase